MRSLLSKELRRDILEITPNRSSKHLKCRGKKPENVLIATIDEKTKTLREVMPEEKEQMWKQIFP